MKRVAAAVAVLAMGVAACSSDSASSTPRFSVDNLGGSSKAAKVCNDMEAPGVRVIDAANMATDAIDSGDITASQLRAECGDLVDAILNSFGDGPLKDQIDVDLGGCGERIYGTLVNNSDQTVDVTLTYELLDKARTRVGDGLVFVNRVSPGQRVKWDDYLFDENYDRCTIDIDTVRPS